MGLIMEASDCHGICDTTQITAVLAVVTISGAFGNSHRLPRTWSCDLQIPNILVDEDGHVILVDCDL